MKRVRESLPITDPNLKQALMEYGHAINGLKNLFKEDADGNEYLDKIRNADGDSYVEVADDDIIHFYTAGNERVKITDARIYNKVQHTDYWVQTSSADETTTSTSYVATDTYIDITADGDSKYFIAASANFGNSDSGNIVHVALYRDSTVLYDTRNRITYSEAKRNFHVTIPYIDIPPSGTVRYRIYYRVEGSGTAYISGKVLIIMKL